MTIRHVPETYPDFTSALLACSSGDEIVLNTSEALLLAGLTTALTDITVRAAEGKRPVLDHSILPDGGVGLTLGAATGWLFRGIVFRDKNGGSAALSCQGAMDIEDCTFEGCDFALRGNWAGTVRRTDFRHVLQHVSTTDEDNVRFEACRFIACEVLSVLTLAGEGSTVENCTFIRCRTGDGNPGDANGDDLVSADVIRACTAHSCQALDPESDRALFRGASVCSNNNAFECTANDGLFAGSGEVANNTTVDPQHVHVLLDQRLLDTSPLVGAGGAAATLLDRHGMAYLSPPSVGAHETARIASAVSDDVTLIVVTLEGGVPDEEACLDRESWEVETGDGVRVAVLEVEQDVEDELVFRLTVHPAMSAGGSYTVTLAPSLYGEASADFTCEGAAPAYPHRRYRNIAAMINAMGVQIQELVGRPQTELAADWEPGHATVFVTSTLDFPESGGLWIRETYATYLSKTDGAFHGVVAALPRLVALPRGSSVVYDDRSYVPPAG